MHQGKTNFDSFICYKALTILIKTTVISGRKYKYFSSYMK